MTEQQAQKFAAGLHEYIRRALAPLAAEVKALRDQPTLEYLGPHEPDATYKRGQIVTHGGSMWHCNRVTATKPGDGNAWTLCVKKGRDAT